MAIHFIAYCDHHPLGITKPLCESVSPPIHARLLTIRNVVKITMPVNDTFDQLAAIQLVIRIRVVHLEIVKLELLFRHLRCVHGYLHVLLYVPDLHYISFQTFTHNE